MGGVVGATHSCGRSHGLSTRLVTHGREGAARRPAAPGADPGGRPLSTWGAGLSRCLAGPAARFLADGAKAGVASSVSATGANIGDDDLTASVANISAS